VFSQLTGGLLGTGTGAGSAGTTGGTTGTTGTGASGVNLPLMLDNGQIPVAINALRVLNLARSFAEPNLVTLNGRPARFQAGGQFPVPIITGATFTGLQGVQFVPFGIQLSFIPVIIDRDRIRLSVQANVSTLSPATGTTIGGSSVSGLNTRNFSNTVELRKGQTLAVAGLIQNNMFGQSQRVPLLGDIPLLNRFFSVNSNSHGDQELVILVTPELVHPMEPGECLPLPGSDLVEPDDIEFYLLGRMESRNQEDFRSPFRTDLARQARFYGIGEVWCRPPFTRDPALLKRYTLCEDVLISGPHGHAGEAHDGPPRPPH
jgi:pilus assembly protein CpaC